MSSTIHNPQAGFINLDHDQLLVLRARRGDRVDVLFGGIWLTEENRPEDRFVEAGSSWRIGQRGRVVAESIGRSGVRISASARGIAGRTRALFGRLNRRRPGWAMHGVATVLALVMSVGLAELMARSFHGDLRSTHAVVAWVSPGPSEPV